MIVFATPRYRHLQRSICEAGGFEAGRLKETRFPDGERYLRIETPVEGQVAAVVGGTVDDASTLDLFDLACGLAQLGARSLNLILPYFGYSTMERAVLPGEIVTAKTRARLISALPPLSQGANLFLVDLHSEGLPYYFEGAIRPFHVYGKPLILEKIKEWTGTDTFVLACTDAGRAKWVQSLANDLGVEASFIFKRRISGTETSISAVSAQVDGRRVVIYDDMIRTGGSLLKAAQAYLDAGATEISALATHGVLPGNSLEKIWSSGLFKRLAVTDSHPQAVELHREHPYLELIPLGALLAERMLEPHARRPNGYHGSSSD
jgi:ribose-phosphate pyrophosphokinase